MATCSESRVERESHGDIEDLLQLTCSQCRQIFSATCNHCRRPLQTSDALTVFWSLMSVKNKVRYIEERSAEPAFVSVNDQPPEVTCINVDILINQVGEETLPILPLVTRATTPAGPPAQTTVNIARAKHVSVEALTIPVYIHQDQQDAEAQLQHVKHAAIKEAVEDIVVAKVNWGSRQLQKYKEKYRQEKKLGTDSRTWFRKEIKTKEEEIEHTKKNATAEIHKLKKAAKREAEALTKQLLRAMSASETNTAAGGKDPSELISLLAQRHLELQSRVSLLTRKQHEKEEELDSLKQCFEEEKKLEEEKVQTFVLKLEQRDQAAIREAAASLETDTLRNITQILLQKHNIRLIGVDCGLSFLLQAPVALWASVMEQQTEIQGTLNQLVSDKLRQSATWNNVASSYPAGHMTQMDIDLGKSFHDNKALTLTPVREFKFKPEAIDKKLKLTVSSIVSTRSGTLLMADHKNRTVAVADLSSSQLLSRCKLSIAPVAMALLYDDRIAITTSKKYIYIVNVENKITVQSHIQTARRYREIAGNVDDTLIVSCVADNDGVSSVDVIDRHRGQVMRTIVEGSTTATLSMPCSLCLLDSDRLLISDGIEHAILTVDLKSGEVTNTRQHKDFKVPGSLCVDSLTNIYVAETASETLFVITPEGQIRTLLTGAEHSEGGYRAPKCICVTEDGMMIVHWVDNATNSQTDDGIVIVYRLR